MTDKERERTDKDPASEKGEKPKNSDRQPEYENIDSESEDRASVIEEKEVDSDKNIDGDNDMVDNHTEERVSKRSEKGC